MRSGFVLAFFLLLIVLVGCFLIYAHGIRSVVLFSHGTLEVPQGRMYTIFNPFRDRAPERVAERLIDDLRTERCANIVRELDGKDADPRVCPVMSGTSGYSLIWRKDGESARVLVYAIPEKQARLWIGFRRDEAGFVASSVTVVW
jgi:hypothetical protein